MGTRPDYFQLPWIWVNVVRVNDDKELMSKRPVSISKCFKFLSYSFLFIVVGMLLPLEMKEVSPKAWGWLEGILGWDMTGFWFSPLGGNGDCRIVNSKVAFDRPGSRIIFGELTPPDRRPYPHLWVEEKGEIIDGVCPPGQPECSVRRLFATVDPVTLQIEKRCPQTEKDKRAIRWGINYIGGLKTALGEGTIYIQEGVNARETTTGTPPKGD